MKAKLDLRIRAARRYNSQLTWKKFLWGFYLYLLNLLFSINLMLNTLLAGTPQEQLGSRIGKWLMYPDLHYKYLVTVGQLLSKSKILKAHFLSKISVREGKLTGRDYGLL